MGRGRRGAVRRVLERAADLRRDHRHRARAVLLLGRQPVGRTGRARPRHPGRTPCPADRKPVRAEPPLGRAGAT